MRGCLQFINILYWIGRYRISASNMVAKRVYQSSSMLTESTAVVEFNCQRICIPRNHEKETHEKVHSYLPDFWILVMHTSRIKPLLKRVHMLKNIVLGRSKQTIFFICRHLKTHSNEDSYLRVKCVLVITVHTHCSFFIIVISSKM